MHDGLLYEDGMACPPLPEIVTYNSSVDAIYVPHLKPTLPTSTQEVHVEQ